MHAERTCSAILPKKLAAYSIAAGAAVGAVTTAQAALQVFDHRDSPLGAGVEDNYSVWDHDVAVLHMDGTYKLSTHDGAGYTFYDANGVTTPIGAADKTDDAIWFTHHDFVADGTKANRGFDGIFIDTDNGGVAGNQINGDEGGNTLYEVYHTNSPDLGLESLATQVGSSLNFATDAGAVMYGSGGVYGPPGWRGSSSYTSRKGFEARGFVGFYLDDADGRHYGWADVSFTYRPYSMAIYGWGYQTSPGAPAELTYEGAGVPGDFTGEGDVNEADIDVLADAIEAGSTDLLYDVNEDSVVDELDLIYHIATLVERTDGGVGTYRGDFNLDGYVDGTDLAILKAGFGLTGLGYAAGNANADDFINGTDLAIFKATFGFSGTPGGTNPPAVPEPATLSLLSLGGLALLKRRK